METTFTYAAQEDTSIEGKQAMVEEMTKMLSEKAIERIVEESLPTLRKLSSRIIAQLYESEEPQSLTIKVKVAFDKDGMVDLIIDGGVTLKEAPFRTKGELLGKQLNLL